jgi:hypothetical protein
MDVLQRCLAGTLSFEPSKAVQSLLVGYAAVTMNRILHDE